MAQTLPPWCNRGMLLAPSTDSESSWPTEPASGRGRSHGTSSAEPFDRWFRYPAGFASDYVRTLVDRVGLHEGVLLDCFMGSGVTGTAALERGLSFAGIEAHPLVAELAALKLQTRVNAEEVTAQAEEIVSRSKGRPHVVSDAEETQLVTRSFTPEILTQLVGMREEIRNLDDTATALALKWALLATLRDVAGVKVGWPYQRPGVARRARHADAHSRFLERVSIIASDVQLPRDPSATATIAVGDSADSNSWVTLPSAHGCITSPPYLNNFDYADATRLELFFWGEVRTWGEMCSEVRADMLVATTQQSSAGGRDDAIQQLLEQHGAVGKEVVDISQRLSKVRKSRERRSKEYDQVAPPYFISMASILENLWNNLEPGATSVWLVGDSAPYDVYIDTPRLIGDLAAQIGFTFDEDVLLRHRGRRWARTRAHDLSERMIIFSKPA